MIEQIRYRTLIYKLIFEIHYPNQVQKYIKQDTSKDFSETLNATNKIIDEFNCGLNVDKQIKLVICGVTSGWVTLH